MKSNPSGVCPTTINVYDIYVIRPCIGWILETNPLNLIKAQRVARPVVKLRGSSRLVGRDTGRCLDRAAVLKKNRDARCPKSVAARGC